jgi:hypothetical protein
VSPPARSASRRVPDLAPAPAPPVIARLPFTAATAVITGLGFLSVSAVIARLDRATVIVGARRRRGCRGDRPSAIIAGFSLTRLRNAS